MNLPFFEQDQCELTEFRAIIDRATAPRTVPSAAEIISNVPIYNVSAIDTVLHDPERRRTLLVEWAQVLMSGPGVLVLRQAYPDTQVLDAATRIYERLIATEKARAGGGGDHFAAAGNNDRIWNSLQKLCEQAPEVFLRYFANPVIAAVCEAWLGPHYQMTAQVNLVHPGGAAQTAHRDYHLGFQTAESGAAFPAHVHALSPVLTLQGAVAHCDMPVASGPTKLLPYSQTYLPGYAAFRRDDFRAVFEERQVQLPLAKGDALFFNPALFHGAGANTTTNIHRMVNLLQVSSAFGRTMESIDRRKMCKLLYPHALAARQSNTIAPAALSAAIAATAEGYAFPTNLDRDPPIGGLAPESQQAFFARALAEGIPATDFNAQLDAMAEKQMAE